ncbi:MAG: histidine phosphatase family protein [Mycobacteriaceae bacterium]|nr:histidine phosphatase family protein [Mycobacteriaceae bacterium]
MPYRLIWKAAVIFAVATSLAACSGGTAHARSITVTFVRHAQSQSNADEIIDAVVPGPDLTPEGRKQAQQLAQQLARNHYDAIYASTMVRTQQTAAPLAQELGKRVEIVAGLQEIDAGWYQGTPLGLKPATYMVAPQAWLHGDRQETIPGSINGNQFNDQFTAAIQQIYDSGHNKPVVFSHNVAIVIWTLLNVTNPQDELTRPFLPNGGRVVITGSPTSGWRLVDWNGTSSF